MPLRVDLNADVGESFGRWVLGDDERLMRSLTSANIACGGHAGDPGVMRKTLQLARAAGVVVGAHPGFPDLAGFGRREMAVEPEELEGLMLYQIGALAAIASAEGTQLRHVKPHGALYTAATRDAGLAAAIARAVAAFDPRLIVVGPPQSELLRSAVAAGLAVAAEGFADRSYEPDGSLTPRGRTGAVIEDPAVVSHRAVRLVCDGEVSTPAGTVLRLRVDTICVHGDTPGAAGLAERVRAGLEAAGVTVTAFHDRQA